MASNLSAQDILVFRLPELKEESRKPSKGPGEIRIPEGEPPDNWLYNTLADPKLNEGLSQLGRNLVGEGTGSFTKDLLAGALGGGAGVATEAMGGESGAIDWIPGGSLAKAGALGILRQISRTTINDAVHGIAERLAREAATSGLETNKQLNDYFDGKIWKEVEKALPDADRKLRQDIAANTKRVYFGNIGDMRESVGLPRKIPDEAPREVAQETRQYTPVVPDDYKLPNVNVKFVNDVLGANPRIYGANTTANDIAKWIYNYTDARSPEEIRKVLDDIGGEVGANIKDAGNHTIYPVSSEIQKRLYDLRMKDAVALGEAERALKEQEDAYWLGQIAEKKAAEEAANNAAKKSRAKELLARAAELREGALKQEAKRERANAYQREYNQRKREAAKPAVSAPVLKAVIKEAPPVVETPAAIIQKESPAAWSSAEHLLGENNQFRGTPQPTYREVLGSSSDERDRRALYGLDSLYANAAKLLERNSRQFRPNATLREKRHRGTNYDDIWRFVDRDIQANRATGNVPESNRIVYRKEPRQYYNDRGELKQTVTEVPYVVNEDGTETSLYDLLFKPKRNAAMQRMDF